MSPQQLMCQVCKALLVLFIVLTTMQAFFAYFWLAPACAVVLFRDHRGSQASKGYSADCVGVLKEFFANPPEGVHVFPDAWICTNDKVRILFVAKHAGCVVEDLHLQSFLMDFTFKTNKDGMFLGAIGPVGLDVRGTLPTMRFFPFMFLLADAEDEEAHRLCVKEYLQFCKDMGIEVTDGFFDCACFNGAAAECGETIYLHRCLQHTKNNIGKEAKKKDEATGKTRLEKHELLSVIIDWIEFSAWLPSDEEFHAFWSSVFQRMEASGNPTDFDEPLMAQYLKANIFNMDGPFIRATWQYGLGSVPLGFTTYAPNAIERSHRLLKGLLDPGYQAGNVADLMVQVCNIVTSRIKKRDFKGLKNDLTETLPAFYQWPRTKMTGRKEGIEQPENHETKVQEKRLDLTSILNHYRTHGAAKTFSVVPFAKTFSTGDISQQVYVMPKYKLNWAWEHPGDMHSALLLAQAQTPKEVQTACASKETGAYDVFRHTYLRQGFVTVYVTVEGRILDGHKHYIQAGGQSEHSVFVQGLLNKGFLDQIKQGPKKSRPSKPHPKPKCKWSERLKNMLKPPAQEECPASGAVAPSAAAAASGAAAMAKSKAKSSAKSLPGQSVGPATSSFLHCQAATNQEDQQCMAQTKDGERCERYRKKGNFCVQHAKVLEGQKSLKAMYLTIKIFLGSAHNTFNDQEAAQVAQAIQNSLEDNEEAQQKLKRSMALLAPRLRMRNIRRVDTQALGDCQFIAVAMSGKLDIHHESLRQQVCDYLEALPATFQEIFKDFAQFTAYVQRMRKSCTWGDHLTLLAMAHLLLRPICVITDSTHEEVSVMEILPPETIAQAAWGEPIWIVLYGEKHYEATETTSPSQLLGIKDEQ